MEHFRNEIKKNSFFLSFFFCSIKAIGPSENCYARAARYVVPENMETINLLMESVTI